jgi:hypothetical protein
MQSRAWHELASIRGPKSEEQILREAHEALESAMPAVKDDHELLYWMRRLERELLDPRERRYVLWRIETRTERVAAHREAHEYELFRQSHPRSPPWARFASSENPRAERAASRADTGFRLSSPKPDADRLQGAKSVPPKQQSLFGK